MFNIVMMLFYVNNLIIRGGGFELVNVSIKNSKKYQLSYKGLGITIAKRFAYFLSEHNTRDLVFTRFRQFNNLTFSKIKRENIWGFSMDQIQSEAESEPITFRILLVN